MNFLLDTDTCSAFLKGMDLLIAATALVHDLTLITHNTQDYVNVPGLRVMDWLVP